MELRQVGKYTIVEKIGAGAMGEVFRARDPVLGRDVAEGRARQAERGRALQPPTSPAATGSTCCATSRAPRARLATHDAGRAAARALEAAETAAPPAHAPGHSGELDGYGLPALLQRLARENATGTLSLLPHEGGGPPATIGFDAGSRRTRRSRRPARPPQRWPTSPSTT